MTEGALPESLELNAQPKSLPVGRRRPGPRRCFETKLVEKGLVWKAEVRLRDQWRAIKTPVGIPRKLTVLRFSI